MEGSSYPAAENSFRKGHDPRDFEAAGEPERYDAVIAALPSDIFEQLLGPTLAAEVGEGYLSKTREIEYFAALCLLCEMDRQFHPFYWTNVADRISASSASSSRPIWSRSSASTGGVSFTSRITCLVTTSS